MGSQLVGAGFDTHGFRTACFKNDIIDNVAENTRNNKKETEKPLFDEQLYQNRFVVERTNAWIDGFKNLLIRFDTCVKSWEAWNHLAFCTILL